MTSENQNADRPMTPEEQAAFVQLQRERESEAIKNTVGVITDGIDFISKQTVTVGESRRIANFVDYLQDLKKDFKKRLSMIQAEGKQPAEAPPAAQVDPRKPELVEA